MDYCDCGTPLDFSPDGVYCLVCYEALSCWPDERGGPRWGGWYAKYVVLGCCVFAGLLFVLYLLLPFVARYGHPGCVLVGLVDGAVGGLVAWGLLGRGERPRRG
jgi:hypothetical protein